MARKVREGRNDGPFLICAAAISTSSLLLDSSTSASGGFEYCIKISGGGGNASSGRVARHRTAWSIRWSTGEKVSVICMYSTASLERCQSPISSKCLEKASITHCHPYQRMKCPCCQHSHPLLPAASHLADSYARGFLCQKQ